MAWTKPYGKTLARLRFRKSLESGIFTATFVVAILTVSISASTILPCPANGKGSVKDRMDPHTRGAFAQEEQKTNDTPNAPKDTLPVGGLGQRALLTKRGGWIEIDERPPFFSWRRWTGS
ncbi:hypothetical protein MVES1_002800 [Malassezia vespertilionis]|uniref:uncharacterized protein n=1 Tax=Malassezia vespertilionis TaxID=2020962 RepID=UPI0024B1A6C4|nr:uncharacterized protein MVES1_002800 [Malassezia vespertilionis]WFD07436.1 hypothetical protein MVES1_002800 [Malassezia vespertilionis]